MALSWFFGGKKKDEKMVPAPEAIEVGSDEDYAIIQARKPVNKNGIYPPVPPLPYPVAAQPYSPLPLTLPQVKPTVTGLPTTVQNQLEGVPFILAPSLDQTHSRNQDTQIEDLRRAFSRTIAGTKDCCYDFKLETSVIREASL